MTNDMLLLNYMYQKGFTEEDMYNEETVENVRRSMAFYAFQMNLAFRSVGRKLLEIVKRVWDQLKPLVMKNEEMKREQKIYATNFPVPKPDFKSGSVMKSQVLNRKPSHQIRKIIR